MTDKSMDPWGQARVLSTRPPDLDDVYDTVEVDGIRYWECGHSGWHMLIAVLADAQTLARYPEDRPQFWEHADDDDGDAVSSRTLETAEQQQMVDEGVNSYLRDAGLPERPNGYRWFQILPPTLNASDLTAAINKTVLASGVQQSDPLTIIPVITSAIRRLYGTAR